MWIDRLVYEGTIGSFDDFSGKADSDKLTLFWGKSKLTIERDPVSGTCTGAVRAEGKTTHTITCTSSGTLLNGFANNPDVVLSFLTFLVVR